MTKDIKLLCTFIFLFFVSTMPLKAVDKFISESAANITCNNLINKINCDKEDCQSKCSSNSLCQFDKINNENVCRVKSCQEVNDNCSSFSWCRKVNNECREVIQINSTATSLLNNNDNTTMCKNYYYYASIYGDKNPYKGMDCSSLTDYNKRNQCNMLKNANSFKELYDNKCNRCTNACGNGKICVGNTCACPLDSYVSNGKCIKSKASGKTINECPTSYSAVENAYNQKCFSSESVTCDNSACSVVSTNILKEHIPVNGLYYNDHGVMTLYTANRYAGTCNNLGIDAYCIDPAAEFSNIGYMCGSALNTLASRDQGFIKIYQASLSKYKDQYLNNTTDDLKYMTMHLAFRFYTYYAGMGMNAQESKSIAFSNTAKALYANSDIGSINPSNTVYFYIKNNLFASLKNTSGEEYSVYRDAVNLFLEATKNNDLWENPLLFTKKNSTVDADGFIVSDIVLSGLDEIRNNPYNNQRVTNLSCDNCVLLTSFNNDLLTYNTDTLEFKIKITDPSKAFSLKVNYFDWRDSKNINVATKNQNTYYQRLLLISKEPRQFVYEKSFPSETSGCRVTKNGKLYGGDTNNELSITDFASTCCKDMVVDQNLRNLYLEVVRKQNNDQYYYITDNWINNGCLDVCKPNNTTDKCSESETGTKKIVISDFTNGAIAGMNYHDYDYTCAVGKTDTLGNSYLSFSNNYCEVYCVEEYEFEVPTNLGRVSKLQYGRYLELKAKGNGSRICYTNPLKEIDYSKFKTDYNNKMNEVNNLKNTFEQYTNLLNSGINPTSSTEKCTITNEEKKIEDCGTYTKLTFNYRINGETKSHTSGSCGESCNNNNNGNIDDIINAIRREQTEVYNALTSKVNELTGIINSYNNCSNFTPNFIYNPLIYYDYEEDYYMNLLNDKNYLVSGDIKTTNGEKYFSSLSNRAYYIGNEMANNEEKITSYNCDGNGCNKVNVSIYNNKYVLKIETKSSNLLPVTKWYTTSGSGKAHISPISPNDYYLGQVLPISRVCDETTKFKYGLELTNLGQDKNNNLGRLDKVIISNKADYANTNLLYECTYEIDGKTCTECEPSYFYRTISLNDVFPKATNDVSLKSGLTYKRNIVNPWDTSKGRATQSEIENLGEDTYLEDNLRYSYTLTPAGMKNIRNYNKTTNYGDFLLNCINGIDCQSEFLDKIKNNEFSGVIENKRDSEFVHYLDGTSWK